MNRKFEMDEGSLDIPKAWHDQTVNVLVTNTSGPGLSLAISRDQIPWGMAFQEYADMEITKISEAFNEFEEIQKGSMEIDQRKATVTEFKWSAPQGKLHQILAILPNRQKALILTATMQGEMGAKQKKNIVDLLKGFKFRITEEAV